MRDLPAAIDVTAMLDGERQEIEDVLFERFREAFAAAESKPCVRTYRACVAAYDEYQSSVYEGATAHGTHQND